jgi:tRNA (guanosine-2'-O-)-methyltransferase
MRRGWGRWRGYVDEFEVVLRQAAERLAESEALIARAWERSTWHARQRDSIDAEILRRVADMPFLGELVSAAERLGPLAELSPPDFLGREWEPGEEDGALTSSARFESSGRADPDPLTSEERPPARLRAAERALAARSRSMVVLLDDLVNARNASAVVRTSEALGLQEVHVAQREGRANLERTITMAAERWLDLFWYRDVRGAIEHLKRRGYRILVSDFSPDAEPLERIPLSERVVIAFGSEQRGVSDALREAADGHFYLPSVGFTSYVNVSVMAGISLYALDQRMCREGLRKPIGEKDRGQLRRAWYKALAGGNPYRLRQYLGWLEDPPEPAPPRGALPQDRRRLNLPWQN